MRQYSISMFNSNFKDNSAILHDPSRGTLYIQSPLARAGLPISRERALHIQGDSNLELLQYLAAAAALMSENKEPILQEHNGSWNVNSDILSPVTLCAGRGVAEIHN